MVTTGGHKNVDELLCNRKIKQIANCKQRRYDAQWTQPIQSTNTSQLKRWMETTEYALRKRFQPNAEIRFVCACVCVLWFV